MIPARRASPDDAAPGREGGAFAGGYDAGGEIGRLHAELAGRLRSVGADDPAVASVPAHEVAIRRLSVGAGYLALAAGYVGAAVALYRL